MRASCLGPGEKGTADRHESLSSSCEAMGMESGGGRRWMDRRMPEATSEMAAASCVSPGLAGRGRADFTGSAEKRRAKISGLLSASGR